MQRTPVAAFPSMEHAGQSVQSPGGGAPGAAAPGISKAGPPTVNESSSAASDALVAAARDAVGVIGLVDAQRLIRRTMFTSALEQTSGNRHAAARLLIVDRRYVVMMAKEQGPPPDERSSD